jgi:hypothetical protein
LIAFLERKCKALEVTYISCEIRQSAKHGNKSDESKIMSLMCICYVYLLVSQGNMPLVEICCIPSHGFPAMLSTSGSTLNHVLSSEILKKYDTSLQETQQAASYSVTP